MKISKQFTIIALMALLSFAFSACSSGSSNDLASLLSSSAENSNSSSSGSGSSSSGSGSNSSSGSSSSSLFTFCGDENYKSPNNVEVSAAVNQSENLEATWWKKGSIYQVWMKSFCDSDGDGCGDFKGVTSKLDYIKDEVGCDTIWLSPIFDCAYKSKSSSGNMHGYDTTDYYKVNDYFGTEADLIELIQTCHSKGMKILFDFVPNHTSSSHSWFYDSMLSNNGKRDWYMWNSTPLNWNNGMHSGNWYTFTNINVNGYFYGAFNSGMPDLNFRNYEVREEMKNVARYWLNKGFDGIRVDAVRYLVETSSSCCDTDESHSWFKELRSELNKYSSPKYMMCEAWVEGNRNVIEKYLGNEDEFHAVLDFDQGRTFTSSVTNQTNSISAKLYANKSTNTGFATFITNHDDYTNRLGTIFTGDEKLMKLATAISLLRPTIPIIYYGTEIGMKQLAISGDARLRGAFDWELETSQAATENSLLKLNKALNTVRKSHSEAFANGTVTFLTTGNSKVVAYTITSSSETLLCVFNLGRTAIESLSLSGLSSFTTSSCLIGDTDAPALETTSVKNLAPCAFRLYILNATEANIFDDETYTAGQTYTQENNGSEILRTYDTIYIRGSFNNWGGTLMTKGSDGWFTVDITFTSSGNIEYKYCENNETAWGDNWGDENGENIIASVEANHTYRFSFRITESGAERNFEDITN